jgi:hypothetical protein
VRPFFEEFDRLLVVRENARFGISGKERQQVGARLLDAGLDSGFEARFRGCEAFTEAMGVKRGDLEDAMATLRAAGAAGEVRAGTFDGRGERQIEDAEEGFGARSF